MTGVGIKQAKPLLRLTVIILFVTCGFHRLSGARPDSLIVAKRLENKEIKETVRGIIYYLYDNQIIDRKGRRSCYYDATDAGDGAKSRQEINLPFLPPFHANIRPPLKIHNIEGEWASSVHFLPQRLGFRGRSIVAVHDPNLFTATYILYPFFLFKEKSDHRLIHEMIENTRNLDVHFKRGKAYNFWPPVPDKPGFHGPLNIPLHDIEVLANSYINPHHRFLWKRIVCRQDVPSTDWFKKVMNPQLNPHGVVSFFNIPNDADDTAGEVTIQLLKKKYYKEINDSSATATTIIDTAALTEIEKWRDNGRYPLYEDPRDFWKRKNSGAWLTWLRDETEPLFSAPAIGDIPLGFNNVDAVINANIMLAAGMMNRKNIRGFHESAAMLLRAIELHRWPDCGLYYPNEMTFPYAVTRAYRDGNITVLRSGMGKLLNDLLALQDDYSNGKPRKKGAFPGGKDRSDILSTAYGLCALLNIGEDIAKETGKETEYRRAIDDAVDYLIKKRKKQKIHNRDAFEKMKNIPRYSYKWTAGIFFSSSYSDLAVWRSEAYTGAIVLEALAKYLAGYDTDKSMNITSKKRLLIESYMENTDNEMNLKLQ